MFLLVLMSGCSLLDLTKDRPNGVQQNAIGDIFGQVGTVADVVDDPTAAQNGDLVTAMRFDAFAKLVSPGTTKPTILKALARPTPLPACVTVSGDTRVLTACDVVLDDGRACVISGSLSRAAGTGGNTYTGNLTLGPGAATCPTASLDFNVYLEGPTSSPTRANGNVNFMSVDPIGDSLSGSAVIDDIAVTGSCTVPSSGSLEVTVHGTSGGRSVDGSISLSFNDDPGCGIIFIE